MKHGGDDASFELAPGPLVRPFAVTRGRAGKDLHELDIITLVVAVRPEADVAGLDREYGDILRMCQRRPLSIAEISAQMGLLLAAVKVLVSDLIQFRSPHLPVAASAHDGQARHQTVAGGARWCS